MSTDSLRSSLNSPEALEIHLLPFRNPQWENPADLTHYKKKRAAGSAATSFVGKLTDCAGDTGILRAVAKIFKDSVQFIVLLATSLSAKNVVAHCSGFADTIKALGFIKGIRDIVTYGSMKKDKNGEKLKGLDLHERNLRIVGGLFQTIIGGATVTKLLDNFKLIELAQISKTLGTAAVPFHIFTSIIEIIKSVIDIAIASIVIHKNNKKIDKIKLQSAAFDVTPQANVKTFLVSHLTDIDTKQTALITRMTRLERRILFTSQKTETAFDKFHSKEVAVAAYKDGKFSVKKHLAKAHAKNAKSSFKKSKEKHDALCTQRDQLTQIWNTRNEKKGAWVGLKEIFEANGEQLVKDAEDPTQFALNDPLNKMIIHKQKKWCIQHKNCNLEKGKQAFGIFINIIAIAALVASMALFFTGIGTLPALLTMTSVWLLISVLGLGNSLFKKYKKPQRELKTNFTFAIA